MKEQKSSVSFVSLSAFLHGAIFLAFALVPAMKLLPPGGTQAAVEFMTGEAPAGQGDNGNLSNEVSSNQSESMERPAVAKPQPELQASSQPAQQSKPQPIQQAKIQPAPQQKLKPTVEAAAPLLPAKTKSQVLETQEQTDDVVKAQEEAEKFAQQQKIRAVEDVAPVQSAIETTPELSATETEDDQVVKTAQVAAAEAVLKDQKERADPLPAPTPQPVVEKLSEISTASTTQTNAPVGEVTSAPAESGAPGAGGSGDSADDARSYTELKQMPGNRSPLYPFEQRRKGQQGQVVLNYFVTNQGTVKDIKIEQSSGVAELDREAVRAIAKFRYVGGQEGWTLHPIVFSLKGQASAAPSRLRTAGQTSGHGTQK